MTSLIEYVATYLATKLAMTLSEDVVVIKMPDAPTRCICIYDDSYYQEIPSQVDAEVHFIRIRIRDASYLDALHLSMLAAGYMQTDDDNYPTTPIADIDTTGIINLASNFSVFCTVVRQPAVAARDDVNQANERVVEFTCKIITKKLS